MKLITRLLALFIAIFVATIGLNAQRISEKLGRGIVAVNTGSGTAFVSWRLLATDPEGIGFNLYRSIGGTTPVKLNSTPITATTNYSDASASTSQTNSYYVCPVINGVEGAASKPFTFQGSATAKRYQAIKFQAITGKLYTDYYLRHVYPGDLDGDGEYEWVVKRAPVDPSNNMLLEAYESDGTFMWRIDLGCNMEQGAATHNPFVLVYDFDGDGKAEVMTRSSEMTIFADGKLIPDMNGDGVTDYRTLPPVSDMGYMCNGDNCPEYISMVDGMTGVEIDRIDNIARGAKANWTTLWGDGYGHRMNMSYATVAYLDGIHPSIVTSRGHEDLSDMMALDYTNKKFVKRWTFSPRNNPNTPSGYHWSDFHNIRVADVDGDGKDEVCYGVCTLDDNGTPLYWAKDDVGHGDRFVVTDIDPSRPGLECYSIQQATNVLDLIYDAKTGERIKTWSAANPYDVNRGDVADVDPRYQGCEIWSWAHDDMLTSQGEAITSAGFPAPALSIWWDGDITREILNAADGNGYMPILEKWYYASSSKGRLYTLYNEGGSYSTNIPYGGRPALYGDVLGDWREEIFAMSGDSSEMRIFSTWTPTSYKIYCLAQNPEYRTCLNNKGYMTTTEPDFFLGEGMAKPPMPPILQSRTRWVGGLSGNIWDNSTANWTNGTTTVNYANGDTVLIDILGSSNPAIQLSGSLTPSQVWASLPVDFSFSGTGYITGSATLLKTGDGALTINNNNTYTGKTTIDKGTIYLNGTLSQSPVWVNKEAKLGGTGTLSQTVSLNTGAYLVPGTDGVAGTLTFSKDLTLTSGVICNYDLSIDPSGTTKANDKIVVNGNLIIGGTVSIIVNQTDSKLTPGLYPIISYTGTLSGSVSSFQITGINDNKYSVVASGGVISIKVEESRDPARVTWAGTNATWDLLTTMSWLLNDSKALFAVNDTVVFNATGKAKPSITVTGSLSVGKMIVDASECNYSFSGTGSIGGAGSLTKTGSGKLTLSTTNSYTGKTSITGGTLEVSSLNNAGYTSSIGATTTVDPSNILLTNTKLLYGGSEDTYTDRGVTLSGNDTVEVSTSGIALKLSGVVTGTSNLVKTGAGTLWLAGANTITGNSVIKAGMVSTVDGGLPNGSVTLEGGTLNLLGGSSNELIVPSGASSFINTPGSGSYPVLSGALKGAGNLTIYIPYVRSLMTGDWSTFTGKVSITTDSDGGQLRLAKTDYSQMAFYLNPNVWMNYQTVNTDVDAVASVSVGELSGAVGSSLSSDYWTIGAKNTNSVFNGTISGGSITKVGTGSLTLSGANTYSTATTVSAGKLIVANTTGSATGTSPVTISNAAYLMGTGTVSGTVTVNTNGNVMPGTATTVGTLNLAGGATFASNAILNIKIDRTANTNDLLNVTGNLSIGNELAVKLNLQLLNGAFAVGNSFKILKATTYSLNTNMFVITPSTPGVDMDWNLSYLTTDGTIRVISKAKTAQTATIAAIPTKTYGDDPFYPTISTTAPAGTSYAGTPYLTSDNTNVATVLNNSSPSVYIVGAGTCNITVTYPGSKNYNAATATTTLVVNKKSQTVSMNSISSKVLGGASFFVTASASSGLPVTFTATTPGIVSISSSTLKILGVGTTDIVATQAGNTNYTAASATQSLLVRYPQAIIFNMPTELTYSAPMVLEGASTSGLPITYESSNPSVASIGHDTLYFKSTGSFTISASQAGNDSYAAAVSEARTIDVVKAKLTIAAVDTLKATGTANPVFRYAYSGLVGSDTPAAIDVLPSVSCSADLSSPIGTYDITLSGGSDNNYAITLQSGKLSVVGQIVTFNSLADRVYGDQPLSLVASATSGLAVSFASSDPEIASVSGSSLTIHKAGTVTVTASQAGNGSYPAAISVSRTLQINKKELVVTMSSNTKEYGTANPLLSLSYSGFVGSDNADNLSLKPEVACSAKEFSAAGIYKVFAFEGQDNNYTFSYVEGNLTITKVTLLAQPIDTARVYGDANPKFRIIYSGFRGTDNVESLLQLPVASVSAGLSSQVATYTISLTGGYDLNYNFNFSPAVLSVTKASLSVTAVDTFKVFGSENPAFRIQYSGFTGSDNVAGLDVKSTVYTNVGAYTSVGEYAIQPQGGSDNNYKLIYNIGKLLVKKAKAQIGLVDTFKTYGTVNPQPRFVFKGLLGTDNADSILVKPTISTEASVTSPVGSYAILGNGALDNNYDLEVIPASLTILKAKLLAKAVDTSRVYGSENPKLRIQYTGFKGSDNVETLQTQPVASVSATSNSTAGTYSINLTEGSALNYTIENQSGIFTVEKAELAVAAIDTFKTYGSENPTFRLVYSGFMGDEDLSVIDLKPVATTDAVKSSDAGTYSITPGGGSDDNYKFVYSDASLLVNKAKAQIALIDTAKIYGSVNPDVRMEYFDLVNDDNAESIDVKPTVVSQASTYSPVGEYEITGEGATDKNYELTVTPAKLSIAKAALSVQIADTSRVYGIDNPNFRFVYSGFKGTDNQDSLAVKPTVITDATSASSAGNYVVSLSEGSDNNYQINVLTSNLSISKAILTVTAQDTTRMKGIANPKFGIVYSGFMGSDNADKLLVKPTASCVASKGSDIGEYPIKVSGGEDSNYDFEYISGILTIVPNTPVLLINGVELKVYPNPVISVLHFDYSDNSTLSIELYNITGRLLKSVELQKQSSMNLESYPAGVYVLQIVSKNGIVKKQIIKQ